MPKINEDKRGLFVELWKGSEDGSQGKPEQISLMTITPGSFRGNHYHKKLYESFMLIEGECDAVLSCDDGDRETYTGWVGLKSNQVKMKLYEWIVIPPRWQHSFFSKSGAKVLIISSKEFDPNDPDTFIY
jgi:dTDP-4-dehydrorhamnose 3,5-epimerase-like enzyme